LAPVTFRGNKRRQRRDDAEDLEVEMSRTRALGVAIAAAVLLTAGVSASAQQFPTRPMRVISPYPAGSASDTTGRIVLDQVAQILGQAFVVEPQPGAGGVVGFAAVAKANPDGYTLVTSSSSMANGKVLHAHLPYDPVSDFIPVAMFGTQPNVLVASKQSGFTTVADLVKAAKAKPGTLTFASAGVGSTSHMAGERFKLATGIDVRHIPFREAAITEVMAGRIDFYFLPLAAAASVLGSGKLNVLAVSTAKRSPLLPNVPTIVEAGYPQGQSSFWVGLSAPAKTPAAVVNRLHDAVEQALQKPDVKEKLGRIGVEPQLMSVEDFGKFFKQDYDATLQLAKDAHIEPTD
jgi:tripartite-type tricarboxylate transporter receptor subunit TctC